MIKLLLTTVFFAFLIWTSACKNYQGCTDPQAANFDSKADDSCCCRYNAYLLFWHNKTTAGNLYYYSGVSKLYYYLDSVKIGSMSVLNTSAASPPCGSDSAFTATIDLGINKQRDALFRIFGNNGISYFQGKVHLSANTCLKTRLIFKK